jgi:hypothetical protein
MLSINIKLLSERRKTGKAGLQSGQKLAGIGLLVPLNVGTSLTPARNNLEGGLNDLQTEGKETL